MAEAQRCISAAEFAEWQAFAALEPFGEEVASWRSGVIASVLANVNRDPKKRPQPYQPSDFMLGLRDEAAGPDLQERIASVFIGSFGGKVRKRRAV